MYKLIRMTVDAAEAKGIPVQHLRPGGGGPGQRGCSTCIWGLRSFSMGPQNLLSVKKALLESGRPARPGGPPRPNETNAEPPSPARRCAPDKGRVVPFTTPFPSCIIGGKRRDPAPQEGNDRMKHRYWIFDMDGTLTDSMPIWAEGAL